MIDREPDSPVPLVSVVVATNRSSPYFDEALASCAAQTHPRVECIVIDNGAPDHEQVARTVRRHLPDASIIRQGRANVSIARNVGVDRARGAYVVFLDDDDRWHPERIAEQVGALEARPDAVASYCGMRVIDEDGRVLVEADQRAVSRLGVARRDTGVISPNLMARRGALIETGGSHPGNRVAQDLGLVLTLAELGSFVFVDRPLVDYRAHAANATGAYRELVRSIDHTVRFHLWAARERGDVAWVHAYRESLRKNGRYAWWRAGRSAQALFRSGRPCAAGLDLAWALRAHPWGLFDGTRRRLARRGRRKHRG